MARIQIGQLLIEQGVLTPRQVSHILKVQKLSHRPFGDLAERLYGIDPKAVEDAWVEQYLRVTGVTNLEEHEMDVQCLRLLNRRQAWQFHALPMNRRGGNRPDGEEQLQMATDADHLVKAVNFATRKLGEPVCFVIAERPQLREFLMKHYPVPQFLAAYAEQM